MRTFIAVDLEDENIRKALEDVQKAMERTGAIMKLVEPRNFHVTLKFLGEIDERKFEEVKHAVSEVLTMRPFIARLRGLGAFPNPYRPRVVFVHVESQEMRELMERIDKAVHKLGFELERRGYVPHLTLARVKARGYLLTSLIENLSEKDFGSFEVREVRIKKSTLTPQGPIYETLAALRLSEERRHIERYRCPKRSDRPCF